MHELERVNSRANSHLYLHSSKHKPENGRNRKYFRGRIHKTPRYNHACDQGPVSEDTKPQIYKVDVREHMRLN